MTTIHSKYSGRIVELMPEPIDEVRISVDHHSDVLVDRTAFLDAVRSEVGVLIIDKADLPEVEPERAGYSGYVGLDGESDPTPLLGSAHLHRQEALRHLALAEYLEAHPPVDEQQVEALAGLLEEAAGWDTNQQRDAAARALIRTGKVTVQS